MKKFLKVDITFNFLVESECDISQQLNFFLGILYFIKNKPFLIVIQYDCIVFHPRIILRFDFFLQSTFTLETSRILSLYILITIQVTISRAISPQNLLSET